jgi:hypothetical protein
VDVRPALHENRARYYDPFTGTYLSVDPRVEDTWEAYNYAEQNPVMKTDPTGELVPLLASLGGVAGSSIGESTTYRIVSQELQFGGGGMFDGGPGYCNGRCRCTGSCTEDFDEAIDSCEYSYKVESLSIQVCNLWANSILTGCLLACLRVPVGTP